jgi:glyoxylase-like metal-dependent hydrolase (beta-lactamase superfamily II)
MDAVPEISAEALVAAIEAGEKIQILDVRAPAKVAGGKIDAVPDDRYLNIPGSSLLKRGALAEIPMDVTRPTVTVCGHGNDSRVVARHLNSLGGSVQSLAGGMAAWMMVSVPRPLKTPPSLDLFVQFDRIGKGALSYLLVSAGEALIVDPARDPAPYLKALEKAHARLVGVADTHVHADYISGASQLARQMQVPYYLHPADAIYPYDDTPGRLQIQPLADGMHISVGRSRVDVIHTPGHSPGSVTYMIDRVAALTGDFLFVNSVGRPDLAAKTEAWAAALWKSIERARKEWAPDLMVYPAHYSTEAERRSDGTVGGTMAMISGRNGAFGKGSEGAFMEWVREKRSGFPEGYRTIKAINVGLSAASDREADDLEFGKNECAIG